MPSSGRRELTRLAERIVACGRCPRLREHCRAVARVKRRSYAGQEYWGRPVPGFGDPGARLLVVGLAPAAHGANRTGRMFTGDRSGDWLYGALHAFGFASRPTSIGRDDGLELRDAWITAAARCAPPGNRPDKVEIEACRPFLVGEMSILTRVRVVLVLGQIAQDAYLAARAAGGGAVPRPRPRFAHGAETDLDGVTLIASYHPSQQNTFTGRLTREAFHAVFARVRALLGRGQRG